MFSDVNLHDARVICKSAAEDTLPAGEKSSLESTLAERKITSLLNEKELQALREELESAGIRGDVTEAIVGYAVPSLELSVATSVTVPVGATKVGGIPDFPKGALWPRRSDRVRRYPMEPVLGAIPLAFLAQVNLAEVAEALPADENPLPASGLLSFFYDAYDQPWGYDPEDRPDFRVIYSGPEESLVPTMPPEDLPEICRFTQQAVSLDRKPSLLSDRSDELYDLGLTDEEHERYFERYWNLTFSDARHINPFHQLLGHPHAVQNANMEVECQLVSHGIPLEAYWELIRVGSDLPTHIAALAESAKDSWRLLLQLDSNSELDMLWSDTGMLYFWVTERGLREKDFNDVWVVVQTT